MNFFKSLAKKRPGSAEPVVETEDIVKNSKKTKKPKNLVVNTEDEISIGGQASIKERIGMEEDGISTEVCLCIHFLYLIDTSNIGPSLDTCTCHTIH